MDKRPERSWNYPPLCKLSLSGDLLVLWCENCLYLCAEKWWLILPQLQFLMGATKSKKIPKSHLLQHLRDTKRNTNTQRTQTYTCKSVSPCWFHTHTRTLSSKEEEEEGGRLHKVPAASARLVTFKGSCCINQVRPVQAWGSVWEGHEARVAELGPVRQGTVREPKLICRDRQALQSVSGPGLSYLWVAHQFASDKWSWEKKKRAQKGERREFIWSSYHSYKGHLPRSSPAHQNSCSILSRCFQQIISSSPTLWN